MQANKVLILTSGGDAPGMNAVIRALVRVGCFYGLQMFGCKHGFQGLIEQAIFPLTPSDVANRIQHGGTFLKSARCQAFHAEDTQQRCRDFLQAQHIDYLVVIGGNGSLCGAAKLATLGGPRVIGIPASIDNDIPGTEYAIGFDTARNTAIDAIDRIRDTASSHEHHFLIEVMGRQAGFLAADVGLACGAEYISTPEFPMSAQHLAEKLSKPKRSKQSSIVIVAEAGCPGHSLELQKQLYQLTQTHYRVCILGHIQRGGKPSALDRCLASQLGECAIASILAGEEQRMIAIIKQTPTVVALPDTSHPARRLTDDVLLKLCHILAS